MSLLSRLAVRAARAYGMLAAGSSTNVSADYLVVAGGASGGEGLGGGGGAGGLLTSTATLSTLNTYTIAVGAGGASTTSGAGNNGSNSSISGTGLTTITSTGGGGGGSNTSGVDGKNGGSGGGARNNGSTTATGGTGTSGQGNNGGSAQAGTSGQRPTGGGGGAGAVGGNGITGSASGAGGAGSSSSISGSSVTYAGGGGGGSSGAITAGAGGSGGGGAGAQGAANATSATVNTGGGGGGCDSGRTSGAGGSGIVIISYTSATPKFVGGTITTSGGKQIHTFTSSGTLSPITPITASYLVVAGGGGGNNDSSGGGGAGGLLTSSTTLYSGATYVVTVGGGGAYTTNGSNSVLSGTGLTTLTATGGGRAGGSSGGYSGASGGSGGGGGGGGSPNAGGAGTSGQGNAGGNGNSSSPFTGGGGGGASAAGSAGGANGGNGGAGTASSISGSSVTYAGGGGGNGGLGSAGTGGAGGGGNGGSAANQATATSGTANTGGGGGGGNSTYQTSGGSGIVIISYAGSQVFNGGLVTTSGGNTIHTFTSTGALTPLTNNLTNSLRFRSSASAYLNRTPSVAGNSKTWTWSGWVKRGTLNSSGSLGLFEAFTSPYNSSFRFASDTLNFQQNDVSGRNITWGTSAVFRDPSAWYHIVLVCDTTQAAVGNAIKMYVNGNQQTVTATINSGSYAQNLDTYVNAVSISQRLGTYYNGNYFDGYLTDVYLIDGQALEPYYFGNNDANGVWKPIQYKGTYGTNGFYLNFADTSALTTSSNAGLGKDTSGNGNYWTTNNISITSGSTYDPMLDVPTNTSATVANYCVLNPLAKRRTVTQVATFSEANLKATFPNAAGNATFAIGTFGVTSGKWYWEIPVVTRATELVIGIGNTGTLDETNGGAGYQATNGAISGFTTNPPAGASYTSGDIIGVALDVDAGTCAFYKNNSLQGTGTGLLSTPQPWVQGNTNDVINANFGQRPFTYTPPTGYVALNTYNLPTPTILQGNKYMDATLYTGTGTALNVVNAGQFKPDFVWAKNRSAADSSGLYDSVRGVNQRLISNLTNAEDTSSGVSAFNSNGFSLGTAANYNTSGNNFVGWSWQAGQGSTSSNTSGSITSTVSVNTTAGFSVVTFTKGGTSTTKTVGHGLGVAPSMIIAKARTAVDNWPVYHISNGATFYQELNTTIAKTSGNPWGNTTPTSSVFSIQDNGTANWVAYCWAEIAGFSKFGSYTGNGSADGPFVYTGFRPKFIMIKSSSTGGVGYNWTLYDTSRNTYNVADLQLNANLSDAEAVSNQMDILSNGFKIFGSGTRHNGSGTTYIYAAFAENPFKNANAR